MDCIFCKIVAGIIPTRFLYQDEEVIAFPDLHPRAPVHILVIPRQHIQSLNELNDDHISLLNHLIKVVRQVAKDKGIYDKGYRLVINTGREGGQVIPHLHLHVMGGLHLEE
jgi:histidine triad (HIT) family protein